MEDQNRQSSSIRELQLARLSAEDRALVKAGVIDQNSLRLTSAGEDLLLDLLFLENKALVVKAITRVQEEDRKDKKEK